ncbi:UbiH/UbiF family hydroxylase [Nitrosovibrio sp. Nv17]|jgi:ubiquinone biosynthesis UbiH/UbiF/VisC/COQ6 family hydroxylase|uniref:UbiH/UbiF family hydroxylase n=1 Tax=Nitrosovibrio sp. Nv17 TaxID=1855339 RepID=UPI000ADD4295
MLLMKFDVVIIGGGLVGAGLALALRNGGLGVALVEARTPAPLPPDDAWDSRIYAVSPGSAAFLQDVGIWPALAANRLTPVHEMAIFGDDDAACLDFSAYDAGLPELAWIVENGRLQAAAWRMLKRRTRPVRTFCPAECASIAWDESRAELRLADGSVLQAALIVGADGIHSWVREQAGIDTEQRAYGQMGVVANFSAQNSHRHVARQWFRRDGVLALLPLPESRVSMVWSTDEAHARTLLAVPGAELCDRVMQASGHALGALQLVTQPAAFPLRFVHAKKLVQSRIALVGDAAHGIHPLAGQGVNLGLRDARELAVTLLGRGPELDCGDPLLLGRYERARKEDILATELATDGLHRLFGSPHPTLMRWRNLGLEITNRLPLLKNQLMRHALN